MSTQSAPIEISVNMTREQACEFLRKATADDEYRARLEEDPSGTLAETGIVVSGQLPEWVTLPSREDVEGLARTVAPQFRLEGENWVGPEKPAPDIFTTCLWLAVGFAAAHRSVQPDDPVAS